MLAGFAVTTVSGGVALHFQPVNNQLQSEAATPQSGATVSYLDAIKAHRGVISLVALAAVLSSLLFLLFRSPSYEATAEILVEPLPQDDELFLGLPLLRDTGDPVRTVETAASLLASQETADLAAKELGGSQTGRELLEHVVEVVPEGGSNIVAVTATGATPTEAAQIADKYAEAAVEVRGDGLSQRAETLVGQLEARLEATPIRDSETRAILTARIEQLRSVLESGDPTLGLSQPAVPPTSPQGASPALILLLAILAGLTLGVGTAIMLELVNRRIRDEDELASLYPMPVLARVPIVPEKSRRATPGSAWHMPSEIAEPFRTLMVQLGRGDQFPSPLMITSPTQGDGKTSSAINLAVALAATGSRVVLLDFDLRNPQVAIALGLKQGYPPEDLLKPNLELGKLLVHPAKDWPLAVLPVAPPDHGGAVRPNEPATWSLSTLIGQAQTLADYVIVDTPPLGEVSDAAQLAGAVASTLVVIRLGNTDRSHLRDARELLDRIGVIPDGCIMIGAVERPAGGYYGYGFGGGVPGLTLGRTYAGAGVSATGRSTERRIPSE